MEKDETKTEPIADFLKKTNGDDLFISGKCKLIALNYKHYFIDLNINGYRPIFLLQPDNSKEKLVLIIDGDKTDYPDNFQSKDKKTVLFSAGGLFPDKKTFMFILREKDDKTNNIDLIKNHLLHALSFGIYRQGQNKENKLCEHIFNTGFIQDPNTSVIFTATFDHEESIIGEFTLTIS